MAIKERAALKNFFKTGLKPTQQNFTDLLDSFWHVNDGLATQDWTNSNFIKNTATEVQEASFRLLGSGTINHLVIGDTTVPYDQITSQSASGFYISAATDFLVSTPGGHITFNPNNFVGIGTSVNNGARLIVSGGPVSLSSTPADYVYGDGFIHYRSDLDKIRVGMGGSYKNLTTEDWVQAAAIQVNASTAPQAASFHLSGNARFSGSYTTGLSIRYFHEGEPFSWAWYHTITPGGHLSGINNGGSGIIGPSVYPVANSYINARTSTQDANDFFAASVQPQSLGLRNSYTHIGYEGISFSSNDYILSETSGFFAAVNNFGGGRGICHMIGSEHVVKSTDSSLVSGDMLLIGMRAVADVNVNNGSAGIMTAGYFKGTNAGDAKVHAIYSDGGSNYLKDGVETEAPSANGAAAWKLGKRVTTPVTPDNSGYVEVMIDGQLMKLALAAIANP